MPTAREMPLPSCPGSTGREDPPDGKLEGRSRLDAEGPACVLSLGLPGGLGPTPSIPGPFPDKITGPTDKILGLQPQRLGPCREPGICKGHCPLGRGQEPPLGVTPCVNELTRGGLLRVCHSHLHAPGRASQAWPRGAGLLEK